jgi:hypothetical protein
VSFSFGGNSNRCDQARRCRGNCWLNERGEERLFPPSHASVRKALPAINWHSGWFDGWRASGQAVQSKKILLGTTMAEALNAQGDAPVRFLPQSGLPTGMT